MPSAIRKLRPSAPDVDRYRGSKALPRLLAADLPPSYVADVAFTRDGAPVLLELNPLYAAGYNVPAAHALVVAALAAELACRAGYPMLSWAEILQTAGALAGEPVEQSPAVWLLR